MTTNKKVAIYCMIDPRTAEVRYIGKTERSLKERIAEHYYQRNYRDYPVNLWIRELVNLGLKPLSMTLDEIDFNDWEEHEIYWVKTMRDSGFSLLNMTGGGDGFIITSEQMKEIWRRPETREKHRLHRLANKKLHGEKIKRLWRNPSYRKKVELGVRRYFDSRSDEDIQRRIENCRKAWDVPGKRKNASEKFIALWANKKWRTNMLRQMRNPAYRKRLSRAQIKWQTNNPEKARRRNNKLRDWGQIPENRDKINAAIRQAVTDNPERSQKISQAQQEIWRSLRYKAMRYSIKKVPQSGFRGVSKRVHSTMTTYRARFTNPFTSERLSRHFATPHEAALQIDRWLIVFFGRNLCEEFSLLSTVRQTDLINCYQLPLALDTI